ncbi:glutathione S-transferase [Roseiarcus fermentans]|uniref:Glutathione S-transferase n=1 Tax=Roseiarcus fermentans TaxID=1473586 RepID=A0A366EHT0_9HYPH|nr:glutathione S-transferase N-terminal domain-containing protein [Roseiarcus fermentans]RBP01270.1 glutathione S-transferase [Roseiarcus fermentans]
MKLYYSPGSCALGIHILLEEIGAPFETQRINFAEREQVGEAYLAINPKAKVPALQRDDGTVLTEFQAIALYLGLTHPERGLVPASAERQARMMEAMDYVIGTVHATGFRRLFRPAEFAAREADHDAVKARGLEIVRNGFALIDRDLADADWVVGDFSLADAALFYTAFWAAARLGIPLPDRVEAHYRRMRARPAVERALKDEGL